MKYILIFLLLGGSATAQKSHHQDYKEPYRPQIHFSPKEKWMNDPNGMVYSKGVYHLFFQYFPDSTVWGPMHWGHATSRDLVHWQQQPIALYPDSLGYIFSGSAVIDKDNTSGFGKNGIAPMVAIFTHHDPKGEKEGRNDFQNQSVAYSLDEGKTWTKYAGNPVLKNPGIKDFRDPKVRWFEKDKKWIMTLAALDRIDFYSSKDLKTWKKESEFGKDLGGHGGVWECPDLFPMEYKGKTVWILIVNINPGGPNGGSATQYFTGTFDGKKFTTKQKDTRWLDYGPDEYAGITWSNMGNRKIFLGWMSNWQYATVVPTQAWRSAMTVPRDLSLEKIGEQYLVISKPVKELDQLNETSVTLNNIDASNFDLSAKTGKLSGPAQLKISSDKISNFSIVLSNKKNEKVVLGYDQSANQYYIDRTESGKVDFEKGFAARHTAPRFSTSPKMNLTLIIDDASVELFADDGLSVMTSIFFPNEPYSNISIQSPDHFKIKKLEYHRMKSIWNPKTKENNIEK
jgi:fructan beta-fructosidase